MKPRASPTWLPAMGLHCWREAAPAGHLGNAHTNVPRRICHHSPTGHEWGYTGSGPSDLALSICDVAFPLGCDGTEGCSLYTGTCSQLAFELHHQLVYDIISRIPRAGGRVTGQQLVNWLTAHAKEAGVEYPAQRGVDDAVLSLHFGRGGDGCNEVLVCRFCGKRYFVLQPNGGLDPVDELPAALLHAMMCGAEEVVSPPSSLIF